MTLTVTDDDAATDDEIKTVTVSAAAGGFALSAAGRKLKGFQYVDLTWSGATSNVDVYRDGALVKSNELNDGAYTDELNKKGSGSYTYRVCESGTSTCSNDATVTF